MGLLALSLLVGLPGNSSLPLDPHEAFVVQSTREMAQRQDWMVPWFNGRARLAKPPMNYWLTAAVACLSGSPAKATPADARMVSLAAGIGLALVCFLAGRSLYGETVALLAVLILVTSRGFFYYVHDGRPDMVYAFFCTLALGAFFVSLRTGEQRYRKRLLWLMWSAYALATLTKGPQMPLALVAGCAIWIRLDTGSWRPLGSRLRPLVGLSIMALLTLPWWLIVQHRVAGGLAGSQLSGSLLYLDPSRIINLFYLYKTPVLVLPWIVLLPFSIRMLSRHGSRNMDAWLPVILVAVPALMLSVGSQQRTVYMLPCLAPLALFLALACEPVFNLQTERRWPLVFALLAACLAIVPLLIMSQQVIVNPHVESAAPWTGLIWSVPAAWLLWSRLQPRRRGGAASLLLWSSLCLSVGYAVLGATGSGWSQERFEHRRLAREVAALAPGSFVTYAVSPDVFVFYGGHPVHEVRTPSGLRAEMRLRHDHSLPAIVYRSSLPSLRKRFSTTLLDAYQDNKTPNALALVQLKPLHR